MRSCHGGALKRVLSLAPFIAIVLATSALHAADGRPPDTHGFGQRTALVLGIERIAGYQSQRFGDATVESAGFHPLFWSGLSVHGVTRWGFSFGALVGATHFTLNAQGDPNTPDSLRKTMVWLRPRVGYAATLRGALGYWVRLGPTALIFADTDKKTHKALSAGAELYAVIGVSSHVRVLVGPHYEIGIAADENASKYGSLGLTLGLIGELF